MKKMKEENERLRKDYEKEHKHKTKLLTEVETLKEEENLQETNTRQKSVEKKQIKALKRQLEALKSNGPKATKEKKGKGR